MALLVVPACLLVLALLVGPMILMFRISLEQYSPTQLMIATFSPDNYVRAATDPYYQQVILTTLGVALLCTALTLVIAYPAAYWVGRIQSRWKSLVVIATLFPLLVNAPVKRYTMLPEGTHTIIMEKNRLMLFEAVQEFLDQAGRT